jgi:hypothetical protein
MTDLPVVCTLGPAALRARRVGLLAGLVRRAAEQQEFPGGRRLRFLPADQILPEIARVVDAERQCCRFLRFQVTIEPDGGPIWLDLSGPAGTGEFLSALVAE